MRIGTGVTDLSFDDGHGLFGFGPRGGQGVNTPVGSDDHDTLQARALYLEDEGQKLLVLSFDLPSGSRLVHKVLLDALTKDGVNLAPGELWVVGTHTHSAPGHYFGNLYDTFGQWPMEYRPDVVVEIAKKGLAAARRALARPIACRVGVARRALWGAGRNRSLAPFLKNIGGDLGVWRAELGLAPPAEAAPEERAVDPRLTVLAFVAKDDARPLATWATWCCHPASIRRASLRAYHRDWPGVAVDLLEKRTKVPFAMIHQAANGDVTPLPTGERRIERPIERVRHLGHTIGTAWAAGFEDAAKTAADAPFELGFRAFRPSDAGLPPFEIGQPVIVGSEELDPGFLVKAFGEARTFTWRSAPHRPKFPALGPLHALLRMVPSLRPSPEHPLGLLRLGSHLVFASPFEHSTYAAWSTEKALVTAWRSARGEDATASVIGLAGDYAGYVTTPLEYDLQHYEGGHTIYGRDQREALAKAWSALIGVARLDAKGPAYAHDGPAFDARVREAVARL